MNKKIFIILIIAFLVRLISLNQSLWLDEGTTAKVIQTYSYPHIISKFSPFDFHPPLYYLFMKFWSSLVGYSEVALRLSSVFFSLLTGLIIFKIGKLLKNESIGFWSMLFFLFNPLIIYYSQEARMYMMATFLLSSSLYFLTKILQVKNEKLKVKSYNSKLKIDLILFNLFNILSFYTFYGSIFFIAAMFIILYIKRKYHILFFSILSTLFSILLISPLLLQQFMHSRQALIYVTHWSPVLGQASIKNLLLIPIKFASGRISFYPKLFYYFITGIWAIIIWLLVLKNTKKNKYLEILLFLPLLMGFIFSFFSPLLQYFRFLYCVIPLSLLLGGSELKKWQQYLVLGGLVLFSFLYLFIPQFHREDWKAVAESLVNNHTVYMILDSSDPLKYYAPMLPIKELRTLEAVELENEVTVIPYTADIYGFDYKKELMKHGFTYKETRHFRGIWYEIWVKNKGYAGRYLYSFILK